MASTTEILAYCGSCKLDLAANIIAKVGEKVVKVQCRTCKKEHSFKAPKGVTEPGQAPAKKASKKKTATGEAPKSVAIEVEWTRLMSENQKAPKVKYTPKAKLELGNVIDHPTFGGGIVMRVIHPDKAEILFKTDLRILIHSRT